MGKYQEKHKAVLITLSGCSSRVPIHKNNTQIVHRASLSYGEQNMAQVMRKLENPNICLGPGKINQHLKPF